MSKTPTPKRRLSTTEPALLKLFKDGLKDIYWVEKHLVKELPKMRKSATSQELAATMEEHAEVTKTHVERLEQIFKILGERAQTKNVMSWKSSL
ncbi:ferritin-like metal-binding protein YciE [Filimonas zeae]|uniref:Ferritin-like metal-binding protein YciE n=1 Tax=Filimonas zeae TaxID=1737353 RepID=A0A917MXG1_9BACT|nr:DUF892 family protein [Filimonas zeae]MDR6338776.1 ferritin-like metal-binding protein YciE [Filimonas zeae]GGH66671.1 hypothetical protein GCM10011379_21080 [Filimonas zeae]